LADGDAVCGQCGAIVPAGNRFCGLCGSSLSAAPEERRWVTVLFADLVGFTTRSEEMDPEDVRSLVDRLMMRLVPLVEAHGGWVNRVIGDALLAVFGAPTAHEDDPERAVRAALALQQEIARDADTSLKLRVGVNSGEVMLGTVGSELTVMGDAVNTAARLQTAAEPGQVLVGEPTRVACGPALRFREIGDLTVKGKARVVTAHEPIGAAEPSRRRVANTPLVGRAREFGAMVACWQEACRTGTPHTITLLGEAGVGKSRLLAEWEAAVAPQGGTVLTGRCIPYGEVLGYRALAEAVNGWAGIEVADDAAAARTKLAAVVAGLDLPDAAEAVEHLAAMTGVPGQGAEPVTNQIRLHAGVRAVLEAAARRGPLALIVDDLHWADAALLDLLDGINQKVVEGPLVLMTAAWPDLVETRPWWGKPQDRRTELTVTPLDPMSAARLATALCGKHALGVDRAEEIERAAGGNPLFAEEVAAMLAARGDSAAAPVLPGSLRASIAARLDQLPAEERGLLGLASLIGPTFWTRALKALDAADRVESLLERVELRGLINRLEHSELGGDDAWAFKHGLIRDVAYEMLPRARRRELHGALVDWLAAVAGDRSGVHVGLLAHHALAAERFDAALGYLGEAADQARRAAAHRAEAERLAEALGLAQRLGRDDLTAGLHARRGRAWARIGVWADARIELETALAVEAAPLAGQARAEVEVELAEVCFWLADVPAQRAHAAAGTTLADAVGRDDLVAAALAVVAQAQQSDGDLVAERETFRTAIARAGGFTIGPLAGAPLASYLAGDVVDALALAEQAAAAADEVRDIAFTMWTLSYLGLGLAANGRYAEADAVYGRARRYGDEHGTQPLTCRAIAMSSGFRYDVGDTSGALSRAAEAVERASAVNFGATLLQAKIDLLFAYARGGDPGKAVRVVAEVDEGIATMINWHEWLWRLRSNQAKAELALAGGDPEAALPFAADALARARRHGRRKYEADALAATGRAHLALGRREEALGPLRAAFAVARSVSDPALILRVAAACLTAGQNDEVIAAATIATERIRAGLPAELSRSFEAYRDRLLAGAE
jgi:class 3 adenylate cyclase/tetratricopeptide (TPR) repeat protein